MRITATGLSKTAAVAAAVAGFIYIAVQVGHPGSDTFTTETDQWVARSVAKSVMAVLALAGISGMYLRQHRMAGALGLVGYLLLTVGFLSLLCVEVIAATVLPELVDTQPGFVDDVVAAANGLVPAGDIGGIQVLLNLAGAGYILGGVLFGLAMARARVLNRWAAGLLAVGALATAGLAVLPESFNRPVAVPVGVALIGLGVSLWNNPRALALESSATPDGTSTRPLPVGAVRLPAVL